jgi:hypothetical protein
MSVRLLLFAGDSGQIALVNAQAILDLAAAQPHEGRGEFGAVDRLPTPDAQDGLGLRPGEHAWRVTFAASPLGIAAFRGLKERSGAGAARGGHRQRSCSSEGTAPQAAQRTARGPLRRWAATGRFGWKGAQATLRLLGLILRGRRAPRRLTGQRSGGRPRGPEPSLVTNAPFARRQVPPRPSPGSARRNAPHALPVRTLAP